MNKVYKEIPGIILATAIGVCSYITATFLPSFLNSVLLALLIGMIIGNFVKLPERSQSGISFTGSKLLEFSILFLAFSINYTYISNSGAKNFSIIAILVLVMLLLTYYLAIKVKCQGAIGWLVGFGTTICGSSAIAALAPSVSKNKEDLAISMAVVNLLGSIGMIVLPFVLLKFDLNSTQMGLMIGGTLHSLGNVAGAGYSISNEVGEAAITFKLARVALLSPALIFFNYLVNKNKGSDVHTLFTLPWYLWGFILITIAASVIPFSILFLDLMETLGKVVLTIAMAAVGLKVSLKKLYYSGQKGIAFGLLIFAIQLILMGASLFFL
jgi:uncharacterized integral membrane protein (TIGR00698 family)